MRKLTFTVLILLINNLLFSQNDTILIDEVYINSSRVPVLYSETSRIISVIPNEKIRLAPVENLQDILKYVSGVDIRERGAEGVQADVSIRGGSFEQALILLNGVKVNDPQTGHHNLNIPIDIESIDRIEILEGSSARIYGQNAFSGAINIITNSENKSSVKLNSFYGSNELYKLSFTANLTSDRLKQQLSVGTKASDGYTENTDFNQNNLYYNGKINTKYGFLALQAGYTEKNFGANSFYSLKYPKQYEEISSYLASLQYIKGGNRLKLKSLYFWKRHLDYFLLDRDDPSLFENNHLTDVFGSEYSVIYNSKLGKTALSIEYRSENLLSSSMGNDLDKPVAVKNRNAQYSKEYTRNVFSVSLEHSYTVKKMVFAGGAITNWNNDFGFGAYPGLDFTYKLNSSLNLIASINASFRTPSFTELFYFDGVSKGSIDLKPEEALSYELGTKFKNKNFKSQVVFFYRKGSNIIDWVKPFNNPEAYWTAKNISDLNTAGFELSNVYNSKSKKSFIRTINFSYTFLNQEMEENNVYSSRYVFDYLKHKASLSILHKISKTVWASWQINAQDREGGFTVYNMENLEYTDEIINYDFYTLVNAKVSWQTKYFMLYTSVNNLFNVDYYDFGNLEMPARWFKIGLKAKLSLN